MTVIPKNGPATNPGPAAALPSVNASLPQRVSGFSSICEALDYAAQGETGYSFYNLRGEVAATLTYAELRERAVTLARKLAGRFTRGDRLAVIAETSPDFIVTFYACQYAGLVPAPMPMPVNLGGKDGYINQIRQMIAGAQAAAAVGPETLREFLDEAAGGATVMSYSDLDALEDAGGELQPFGPDEFCYIQYSSGSSSAPKGVIGLQRSVCANLTAIARDGMYIQPGDRATSWLPLYHDMGLIGFVLTPMTAQVSVDFLATSDFVRRPLLWLRIMTDYKTTITYSPSFGYELAAKRSARAEPGAIDLSAVRVAGIGGDMVRPEALNAFAEAFGPVGFNRNAFAPSYGMAEATLAISFPELGAPIMVDEVDMRHYTRSGVAQPASALTSPEHKRGFVLCGRALPGHEIEVRGETGERCGERQVGRIYIKGP
ncbi:MAG: AMP-binding protein, partial [Oricola sp.]|nr:AMP-binding protein [Oricola sp.]